MDGATGTLFAAAEAAADGSFSGKRTIFFGACLHEALRDFDASALTLQQHFKPYEAALSRAGFSAVPDFFAPDDPGGFDLALALVPKNTIEARAVAAGALLSLRPGGVLVCAADNKAGGQRLASMLRDFGLEGVQQFSKNRARAVWTQRRHFDERAVNDARAAGAIQPIEEGRFHSQPGLFSWNRTDRGSALLSQYVPRDPGTACADFGCGYGYLSRSILEQSARIQTLVCVDADYRALRVCERNLSGFDLSKRFVWADLSQPVPELRNLDAIVMNPPFHEGRSTEPDLGRGFIMAAHAALKPGGQLYMVANRQLPYEDLLRDRFSFAERLSEGEGYKIFAARR